MKKECEICGAEFECTHNESCWCLNHTLSKEMIEYLRNNYKNCLCETCLKHHDENEKKILSAK
jgi:hypothetical protein